MFLYGGLPETVSFAILILFSLYLGLYHCLFGFIIALLRRTPINIEGALCLTPFAWGAVELARARITGFPWDLIGNSQVDNLLVTRIAPIAGVMGISFLIAAINASFTFGLLRRSRLSFMVAASALIAATGLQCFGTCHLLPETSFGKAAPANIAILLQENLEVGAPGREVRPLSEARELELLSEASLQSRLALWNRSGQASWVPLPGDLHPAIVVWPEAPSHLQSNDPSFRAAMAQLAIASGAPLVIGSLGVDFNPAPARGYYLYDSASLFSSQGAYEGRYDKIHLVPWGEYIPFKNFFAFARKLTEGAGDMDPGHDRSVFSAGGHTYGVFVCYESIFGDEVRRFTQNGAEVLVQISDDGWYGDTGAPWQHLNMARMRAIENHRWLLRATNTGITTAIDPLGRTSIEAPRHIRGAFAFPFAFDQGTTFYTRHGDWFAWLCVLVTTSALAFTLKPYLP